MYYEKLPNKLNCGEVKKLLSLLSNWSSPCDLVTEFTVEQFS